MSCSLGVGVGVGFGVGVGVGIGIGFSVGFSVGVDVGVGVGGARRCIEVAAIGLVFSCPYLVLSSLVFSCFVLSCLVLSLVRCLCLGCWRKERFGDLLPPLSPPPLI